MTLISSIHDYLQVKSALQGKKIVARAHICEQVNCGTLISYMSFI